MSKYSAHMEGWIIQDERTQALQFYESQHFSPLLSPLWSAYPRYILYLEVIQVVWVEVTGEQKLCPLALRNALQKHMYLWTMNAFQMNVDPSIIIAEPIQTYMKILLAMLILKSFVHTYHVVNIHVQPSSNLNGMMFPQDLLA